MGPASELLCFLGNVIDTVRMECRLPEEKLLNLRQEVCKAIKREKIRLRDLQFLLGKRNFACRIMPMGRIFCRRGYDGCVSATSLRTATKGIERGFKGMGRVFTTVQWSDVSYGGRL